MEILFPQKRSWTNLMRLIKKQLNHYIEEMMNNMERFLTDKENGYEYI